MLGNPQIRKLQLGKSLKAARDARGLTQEQISRILDISCCTYSAWETGRSAPGVFTLIDLSNFYRIPLAQLVGKTAVNSTKEVFSIKKRDKRASAASL